MKHITISLFILLTFIGSNKLWSQDCSIPTPLPYFEYFQNVNAPSLPPCTLNESILPPPGHQFQATWITGNEYASSNKIVAVDFVNPEFKYKLWYFTPKFSLSDSKQYRLIYHYKTGATSISDAPSLLVYYGSCQSSSCMANLFAGKRNATNNYWKSDTAIFTPTVAGNYFIGFYHIDENLNDHEAQQTVLDSISLIELAPLPVNMSPLKANLSGNTLSLNWKTYTESNNVGFDIEQSRDGSYFYSIGFTPSKAANGNSTSEIPYTWFYQYPSHAFYRLKQRDKNGRSEYSNIVSSMPPLSSQSSALRLLGVSSTQLQFSTTADRAMKIQILIVDGAGKQVVKQEQSVSPGDNLMQVNIASLAKGTYYITRYGIAAKPVAFIKY